MDDDDEQNDQQEEEENPFIPDDLEDELAGDEPDEEEPELPDEGVSSDEEAPMTPVVTPKQKKLLRPMRPPVLSPYETAAILNARANEIANNAPIYIKIDPRKALKAIDIAQEELRQRKIVYLIARPRPDGRKDYVSVADVRTRFDK